MVSDDSGLGTCNVVLQGPDDAKALTFRGRIICLGGIQREAGTHVYVLSFISYLGEYSTAGIEGDVCLEAMGRLKSGKVTTWTNVRQSHRAVNAYFHSLLQWKGMSL